MKTARHNPLRAVVAVILLTAFGIDELVDHFHSSENISVDSERNLLAWSDYILAKEICKHMVDDFPACASLPDPPKEGVTTEWVDTLETWVHKNSRPLSEECTETPECSQWFSNNRISPLQLVSF